MSGRSRGLFAALAVLAVVLGAGRALRRELPPTQAVATFESTLRGEPVQRGGFELGERVETPPGGRVVIRAPGGAELQVEENSVATFDALDPLRVELIEGRLSVRSADEPLTLQHLGQLIQVGPRAAVELASAPAELVVTSGVVRLDGRSVVGRQSLRRP